MRTLYLDTLVVVTLIISVFSIINMSGKALTRVDAQSLASLPSHFRWGSGGYVTVAQYYDARNQVGNLSGIARSELRSQSLARIPGLGLVDVFAAPNGSMVYSGLNHVSGVGTAGPGQVIVISNSESSSFFNLGQVIQANFSFYAGFVGGSNKYVSMVRNLTVAGFADSTVNGFGYLTNSQIINPARILFPFPTLVANWDDLIPSMIDLLDPNKAGTFFTGLFVYVKPSGFTGLDTGAELAKAQSLQGQIQSTTSSIGGTTDSWLIGQLEQGQSESSYLTRIALVIGTVMMISSFSIIDTLTSRSIKTPRSGDSETDSSKSNAALDPDFKQGVYLRMLVAGAVGVVVGILVSILTVSILVFSLTTFWTPSLETLAYSAFYGTGLAVAVWFQSRDTISRSNNQPPSIRSAVHKPD